MKSPVKKFCVICDKDVGNKYHRVVDKKYYICDPCNYFFEKWKNSASCLEIYKGYKTYFLKSTIKHKIVKSDSGKGISKTVSLKKGIAKPVS